MFWLQICQPYCIVRPGIDLKWTILINQSIMHRGKTRYPLSLGWYPVEHPLGGGTLIRLLSLMPDAQSFALCQNSSVGNIICGAPASMNTWYWSQHEHVVLTLQTGHSSLVSFWSFWRCKHVGNTSYERHEMTCSHNVFPGCKITTSQRHFFTSLQRDVWRLFHVFRSH
jgi:hypothetical protein